MINKLIRSSYICDFDREYTKNIPLGKSKIGGCPDLPKHIKYPENLSFIAQINLEELNISDMSLNKGILYFFYDFENQYTGYELNAEDGAKVIYYNGDISELCHIQDTEEIGCRNILPEFLINFICRKEAPMYEEYRELTDVEMEWDKYWAVIKKMGLDHDGNMEITKLFGYADLMQGSLLKACYEKCNDKTNSEKEWILLFQVDTISDFDKEYTFGDYGRLYFYIKEEDLLNQNFQHCLYFTQQV